MQKLTLGIAAGCALAANTSISHADTIRYLTNPTGTLVEMNVVGATADPTLTVTPTAPRFELHGLELDFSNNADGSRSFTGIRGLMDFESYATAINAGIGGKATVTNAHNVYEIGGAGNGTVTWNAATRTLTLGQKINYTSQTDSAMGTTTTQTYVNQSSDSQAIFSTANGAIGPTCTPSGTVCNGQTQWFGASRPNLEGFYLTLTFDANLVEFTGQAVSIDVGGTLPLGKTGNQLAKYTLATQAGLQPGLDYVVTPVPAAAWLFGSALIGLATARSRRAA